VARPYLPAYGFGCAQKEKEEKRKLAPAKGREALRLPPHIQPQVRKIIILKINTKRKSG
jgi:hypothetical protein